MQEPLARLEAHLKSTPHRVLLLAESDGRRESLLEQLRDHKIDPPSVKDLVRKQWAASLKDAAGKPIAWQ